VNFLLLARPLTDVYRSDRNGLSITSRFQESVNDTDISEPFRAARFGFLVLENAIREIDEFRSELIAFWEFGLLHAAVDDDLAFQVGRHFVCRIHSQHTLRAHTQQDVDLDRLFSDVAVYNARVMGSAHVANVTDLACRTALNFRGVAHLNLPTDIQDEKTDERSKRNVPHHTAEVPAASARLPGEDDILRAASVLNEGKKIAILAGQGALNARTQIVVVAERLKAPNYQSTPRQGGRPGRLSVHDWRYRLIGYQSVAGSAGRMRHAIDRWLIVSLYRVLSKTRQGALRADRHRSFEDWFAVSSRSRHRGRLRQGAFCAVAKAQEKRELRFSGKCAQRMKKWDEIMRERSMRQDKPMKPQVVAWELGKRLEETAIISSDSGTISTWFARHIPVKSGQKHSLSGTLATMANGLPYTIAAQIAYPDRQCVGFVGDGGFTMLMGEFATAVKYQLPIKIVVIKNNTLGQIKWEQMVFLGNPEYGCDLNPIDFCGFAQACGGTGFRIEDPATCGAILDQALKDKGPVVIEAVVDPYEPPMPPKVTLDQAEKLAKALAKGTPNRREIALTIASDKVRELV
jgi:pyruvate dehydrogenase (quinone)